MKRLAAAVFVALVWLVVPGAVEAQSAIGGTVRDTSGAVLPGVTVEASSSAIIEGSRTAMTDGQGLYRIVDLRPGTYTVTFSLTGFQAVRREGVNLPADFTATINADLRVGAIEETLTVTGDAPVVDTQSTARAQVLNRDVLDALPTGRSFQSVGQLVIGVNLNSPDVGGSSSMQQTYMSAHGMSSANNTVQVDGMMMNSTRLDGQVQAYYNDAMSQEVSYRTSGAGADVSAGGVTLNMIPREGGNRFSGAFFSAWSDGGWQGDNLTEDLKSRGLTTIGKINRIYDLNLSEGGPIKKDKLWFFVSTRRWAVDSPVADTVMDDGSQGVDDQYIKSAMMRLTWQASPRNKFGAYYDRLYKIRGHDMTAGVDPETAAYTWRSPVYYTAQVKWTSAISNKLMAEAGYATNVNVTDQNYQPGIDQPRGTAAWFAGASRFDRDLSTRWAAPVNKQFYAPEAYIVQASMSYVTGSHSIKTGLQWRFGPFLTAFDALADLEQDYRSGVPDSVIVRNTPLNFTDRLNADTGIYVQDTWTLKRLTLMGGLRFEHLNAQNSAATAPAGRFVAERSFPERGDLPNWNDLAPRFGLIYDLFGNSKTALKASVNRYNTARTTGFAALYNPLASATARLTWRDQNSDDIAQGALGCVYLTAGCEINLGQLPSNFGARALRSVDPDFQRPYNIETNIGIQHELLPRVSVTASWIRNTFKDLTFSDNLLRTRADYSPVNVVSPLDGEIITVYNLAQAKVPLVETYDTNATDDRKQTYNGFELSVNARLPRGAVLFGGASVDRTLTVNCDDPDNPNSDRFCDQTTSDLPFRSTYKLSGVYPLAWGIQIGGTLQSIPGDGLSTNWLLTNTTRYATDCVGPCTPGALVFPTLTEASLTVPLVPAGSDLLDRLNQLDLRVSKTFTFGRLRTEAQFEMFNTLNSDSALTVRSSNYLTTAYRQVASAVQGRIIRVGAQMKW